jgi:hypothetical protein
MISAMKSHEVMKQAIEEQGVKAVAAAMKVSPALVYKWCEAAPAREDPDQSGARNPLDRVRDVFAITKDIRLIRWLCNSADGFFVPNPHVGDPRQTLDQRVFVETHLLVREFSELLETVTKSIETLPGIDPDEADNIRQKWEDLKACVECFVRGCEQGMYDVRK